MYKVLTAFTEEIDDPEKAVAEILEQLGLDKNIMKNSAGIYCCPRDYYNNGTAAALEKALPFHTVGTETSGMSVSGEQSFDSLAVTVITGDDISFKREFFTVDNNSEAEEHVKPAAARLTETEKPKLILFLCSLNVTASVDSVSKFVSEYTGGDVPIYGYVASASTENPFDAILHTEGERYRNAFVLTAVYGNIVPEFKHVSVIKHDANVRKDIVTKSDVNILYEVNGMPLTEYLASINLDTKKILGMIFLLTMEDGSKTALCPYPINKETDSIPLLGNVPLGAQVSFAVCDSDEALNSSRVFAEELTENIKGAKGVLMASCILRVLALSKNTAEFELINKAIAGKVNYLHAIAGGEICPSHGSNGSLVNNFHNVSLTACILK